MGLFFCSVERKLNKSVKRALTKDEFCVIIKMPKGTGKQTDKKHYRVWMHKRQFRNEKGKRGDAIGSFCCHGAFYGLHCLRIQKLTVHFAELCKRAQGFDPGVGFLYDGMQKTGPHLLDFETTCE